MVLKGTNVMQKPRLLKTVVNGVSHLEPMERAGKMTRGIEGAFASIPSSVYVTLAAGSLAISATTGLTSKRKELANFFGLWVPTLLLLGIHSRISK